MIPVRLEMKNFLAYRDPEPLEFSNLHLACLIGENGAGKSAILDAITWALWGRARATHSDLIHSGQSDMAVVFSYSLHNALYRVTRSFVKTANSQRSNLIYEVLSDEDEWINLSDAIMTRTEKRIASELSLDFETFISSAYIQQGDADRFTAATPARRKEILYEVLGLNIWADYESTVKQRIQKDRSELDSINGIISSLEESLKEEDVVLDRKKLLEQDLVLVISEISEIETTLEQLNSQKQQLTVLRGKKDSVASQLREARSVAESLRGDLVSLDEERDSIKITLADAPAIEAEYRELQRVLVEERLLTEKATQQLVLLNEKLVLENAIRAKRAELVHEIQLLESRVNALQEKTAIIDSSRLESKQIDRAIEDLGGAEKELTYLMEKQGHLRTDLARLNEHCLNLDRKIEDTTRQLDTVKHGDDSYCPLCEQPLTEIHRADLARKLAKEIESFQADRIDTERKAYQVEIALSASVEEVKVIRQRVVELERTKSEYERIQAEIIKANELLPEKHDLLGRLDELKASLDAETYAIRQKESLAAVEKKISLIGYEKSLHDELRTRLDKIEEVKSRYEVIQTGDRRLSEISRDTSRLLLELEKTERQQHDLALLLDKLAADELILLENLTQNAGVEADYQLLKENRITLERDWGACAAQLASLNESRQVLGQNEKRKTGVIEEVALGEELRIAFGKNGIPAMVIEAAIPEIESEANAILAKFSAGGLQIRFETQKESAEGGIREALDILISDEKGTRKYDLLSGGEAFRVDLAIRLAISRLLARRSGSQLRTLFLDEGFGTQDEGGRHQIVDILNSIKDDFDLILVITHIDELKEAFPSHIEVEKTAGGSKYRVVG